MSNTVSPKLTCGQAQAFHRPSQGSEQRIAWVVLITVVMMVIEIVAGWRYHSMALLADGWHMSTHAMALGVSLLAYRLSRHFAGDPRFAFGTWKIEILGAYTSALILTAVALSMVWESFGRLFNPGTIHYGESMLVAVVGLIVNLCSAWLLGADGHSHDHSHHKHDHDHDHDHDHTHASGHSPSHHGHDLNKHAAYLHVLTDAATSVLAIVALLGGMLWGAAWLDPLMGLVGGGVILVWAKGLLVETSRILIDADSEGELSEQIRNLAQRQQLKLHDLHVWRIGERRYATIIGLENGDESQLAAFRQALEQLKELAHLTIERS